jgi:signal transduction histidine kinase/CheY-like chemotaxis protein
LLNRHPEDLIVADDPKALGDRIRDTVMARGEWTGELLCRRRNGETYPIESRVFAIRDERGEIVEIAAIQQDITERKRSEKELSASEERFRGLFEDSPISLWEENFSEINAYFGRLRASGVRDFKKHFDDTPGDVGKCAAMMRIVDVNRATLELYEAGDKQSFLPYLSDRFHEGSFDLFKEELVALAEGNVVFERETVTHTLTGRRKHICLRLSVMPGYEDTLSKVYISIVDVTERKRLEEQLLHSQKMEALGTLAGGVAHDFNNILAGIIGYVTLMKGAVQKESPLLADLEAIERLSWRSADLTKSLLVFSRKSLYQPGPININELIEEALTLVGRTSGGGIRISAELSPGILNAHADRGQLHQVIMNLCINACEAMPGGGTLTVWTGSATPGSEFFGIHPGLKKGPYVTIRVSDTGIGMDAATRARMFEPFFSTKTERSGTGLGLSVVSGIVERHGGCIEAVSEPGKGTTITFSLPATKEEERKAPPRRVETLRGDETIMVVDDETNFREGTARWLKGLGYTVLEASSGEEALEVLKGNKDRVRLVLLDMIMKEMGGAQTFAGMRGIVPDLAVVLCTGYSVNGSCQRLLEEGARGAVQKPFAHNELALRIRGILDGH